MILRFREHFLGDLEEVIMRSGTRPKGHILRITLEALLVLVLTSVLSEAA